MAAQVGVHVGNLHALLGARGDHLDLHLRMLGQQPQQFHARVTRPTNDTDLDHLSLQQRGKTQERNDKSHRQR
ncbi:hypothetical protein D3C80_2049200 [compost metagenome]